MEDGAAARSMRTPILIGVGMAVVLLSAVLATPALTSRSGRVTAQAVRQAEQARREVQRYDMMLPMLDQRLAEVGVAQASLDEVAQREEAQLSQLRARFDELAREAARSNRSAGLPPPEIRPAAPGAAGLKAAAVALHEAARRNQQLLEQALRDARQALQAGRSLRGVPQVTGAAELLRAAQRLGEARQARVRLEAGLADALSLAAEWKQARTQADYYSALDVGQVLGELQEARRSLAEMLDAARARAEEWSGQVAARQAELEQVREQLRQAHQRMSEAEGRFRRGDDASFQAYRREYRALSQQVRELAEREHQLEWGAWAGAEFQGDDLLSAERRGGQEFPGLVELRRRSGLARESVERLEESLAAMDARIEAVGRQRQEARTLAEDYGRKAAALLQQLEQRLTRLDELAQAAMGHEEEAVAAAKAAQDAFAAARSAAEQALAQARQAQQQYDPQRRNERLRMLLADNVPRQMGEAGQAYARLVAGQVLVERLERLSAWERGLDHLGAALEAARARREGLEAVIQTTRDQALEQLQAAREAYEKLSGSGQPTAWVPQSLMAAVHTLLARADAAAAQSHLQAALEAIEKALARRERSPYLRAAAELRDHLRGLLNVRAPAPQPPTEESREGPEDEGGQD